MGRMTLPIWQTRMPMPWLIVVVLLITSAAAAQTRPTTGDVIGVVYDEQRAVLQAATITATNTETNQVRVALTDAVGRFALLALPPGRYTVKTGLTGFVTRTRRRMSSCSSAPKWCWTSR